MAGFAVQFYLIGAALFGVSTTELHRRVGYLLVMPLVVPLIVAVAGRLGARNISLSALLLVLIVVQALLPSLRSRVPWLAALHPVNALALIGVTAAIGRAARPEAQRLGRASAGGAAAINDRPLASELVARS
jgi:hypothetical protein